MKRRPRCTAPEHVGSSRAARGHMFDGRHTYFICQTCFDVREREAERIRIRVAERLAPRLVPTGPRLVKTATATQ